MGEVYRARDTRLERTVAIKILPAALAGDGQLRERFEREARAISSLQHPHICALFDVGEAPAPESSTETIRFLVLELLEGETLAARLARAGPIPFDEAIRLAIEICDALATAHRSGIVHRDLKPANVFLVRGGTGSGRSAAKLLDFGLAKAATPVVAASGLSMLPTTPPTLTAQGTILGTFQYMAPEQIEGIEADARTDIFAFGALFVEMLTGRAAFEGKSRATLLGAILKDQPPPASTLQAAVPKSVDRIIATCLEKDPEDRWQSARDLLRELQWVATGSGESGPTSSGVKTRAISGRGWAILAAVAAVSVAAGIGIATLRRTAPRAEPLRFQVSPPEGTTYATPAGGGTGLTPQVAISPDGKTLVFVANGPNGYQLWLRPLDAIEARPLASTDGSAFPFWSPDSRYVAFFADGKLKKVSAAGGPALVLCDAPSARGGSWNRDNVIIFTPNTTGALQRVSSAGGIPGNASALDTEYGETSHRFPSFLPDGRHFLYTGTIGTCCPPSKPARVKIGVLDSLDATPLMQAESMATYARGHLLFNREGTLMAQPFDASARVLSGEPFPVAEAVSSEGSRYASFSVVENGVLVYARGSVRPLTRLAWFDRTGRQLATVGASALYYSVGLSPDERKAAVSLGAGAPLNRDIWIVDIATGVPTRLTFDANDDISPIWSPDSQRVVFAGNRSGTPTLLQKSVSGSGNEEVLFKAELLAGGMTPTDWSADGSHILYTRGQGVTGTADIWMLPLLGGRKPSASLATNASEVDARFSPDGKWIAYSSTESGQPEVYVQPFPATGAKFQVSQRGGARPAWRGDGQELFFLSLPGDVRLMAAPVETAQTFHAGAPVPLFSVSTIGTAGNSQYGVSRDGKRFLVNTLPQQTTVAPLTVVVNWLSGVPR
jgi:Tol biopolymer transport system component